jgi:NADH-quinone oxidoreductase subunit H
MPDLGYSINALAAWFGQFLPALPACLTAAAIIYAVPIVGVVLQLAGVATMAERKIAAAMQRRVGPNYTDARGLIAFVLALVMPWQKRDQRIALAERIAGLPVVKPLLQRARRLGLIQLAADGLKSIAKEDIIPDGADQPVFRAAPYLAVIGSILAFAVIPISQHWQMADLSVGVVYVSGVTGLVVVGLLMAGWGSNNKWAILGGMRAVAQIVSYEIPMVLCIAAVVLWSGTLGLHGIIAAQYHDGVLSALGWNLFQSPFFVVLAVVWVIATLAECNRTPFDLAEADSELVAGFNTEYSGMRWVLFALSEYIDMFLAGALFAVLFLGGYQSPVGDAWITALPPVAETLIHGSILLGKTIALILFFIWLRWTLPRFRLDQVMRLAWTKLTPIALVCLVALAVTQVLAAGPANSASTYGRIPVPSGPAHGLAVQGLSWLIGGGALVALAALARLRRDRPLPDEMRRIVSTPAPRPVSPTPQLPA